MYVPSEKYTFKNENKNKLWKEQDLCLLYQDLLKILTKTFTEVTKNWLFSSNFKPLSRFKSIIASILQMVLKKISVVVLQRLSYCCVQPALHSLLSTRDRTGPNVSSNEYRGKPQRNPLQPEARWSEVLLEICVCMLNVSSTLGLFWKHGSQIITV